MHFNQEIRLRRRKRKYLAVLFTTILGLLAAPAVSVMPREYSILLEKRCPEQPETLLLLALHFDKAT